MGANNEPFSVEGNFCFKLHCENNTEIYSEKKTEMDLNTVLLLQQNGFSLNS